MANIPDDPIMGRLKHMVQSDGQFDNAEAGAEVAAGHRDGVQHLVAQFPGQFRQLFIF